MISRQSDNLDPILQWRLHGLNTTPRPILWIFWVLVFCGEVAILCFAAIFVEKARSETFDYRPHTCEVLAKRIESRNFGQETGYRGEVQIGYEWQGSMYTIWTLKNATLSDGGYFQTNSSGKGKVTPEEARAKAEREILAIPIGSEYQCWVDSREPRRAILKKSSFITKTTAICFGGILLLVATFMISRETLRKHARKRELLAAYAENPETWTRGKRLEYRLDPAINYGRVDYLLKNFLFTGLLFACITGTFFALENGISLLLLLTLPLMPVFLHAIFSGYLVQKISIPEVEVAKLPIQSGESAEIFCLQPLSRKLRSLTVTLVCESESARGAGKRRKVTISELFREEIASEDFADEMQLFFEDGEQREFSGVIRVPVGSPPSEYVQLGGQEYDETRWLIEYVQFGALGKKIRRIFPIVVN